MDDKFYVVEEGSVRISKANAAGQVKERGQCVGDLALFMPAPRTETAQVVARAKLWAIDGALFRFVVSNNSRSRYAELKNCLAGLCSKRGMQLSNSELDSLVDSAVAARCHQQEKITLPPTHGLDNSLFVVAQGIIAFLPPLSVAHRSSEPDLPLGCPPAPSGAALACESELIGMLDDLDHEDGVGTRRVSQRMRLAGLPELSAAMQCHSHTAMVVAVSRKAFMSLPHEKRLQLLGLPPRPEPLPAGAASSSSSAAASAAVSSGSSWAAAASGAGRPRVRSRRRNSFSVGSPI